MAEWHIQSIALSVVPDVDQGAFFHVRARQGPPAGGRRGAAAPAETCPPCSTRPPTTSQAKSTLPSNPDDPLALAGTHGSILDGEIAKFVLIKIRWDIHWGRAAGGGGRGRHVLLLLLPEHASFHCAPSAQLPTCVALLPPPQGTTLLALPSDEHCTAGRAGARAGDF